jgi:hypothetical protein
MVERVEHLQFEKPDATSRVEPQQTNLFATGPAEFLCSSIATMLGQDPAWKAVFGEFIDPYKRMDYPVRAFPALRIYNNGTRKLNETWYEVGSVVIDIIWPASVRRKQTQQIPDTVSAALMQQFRRPSFFGALCAITPGLNELGKTFDVDKSLAFEWAETLVPLTQCQVNFRMNLNEWDNYLETDGRTKDDPFTRTLANLTLIATTIAALRDDGTTELTMEQDTATT